MSALYPSAASAPIRRARWRELAPIAVFLALGALYYTDRIVQWLAHDDEGGYLYAAWRITLGELPYRDFLTPQLPVFLYPGALVLSLSGNSALAARLSMAALVLAATFLTYLTARRLWGQRAALLGAILMLVESEMYWAARFYRPEAPMLFWAALGVYLFVCGYPAYRQSASRSPAQAGAAAPGRDDGGARAAGLQLALAGAALGLAMMSKLFGALPMAGIGLFLASEWLTGRDRRAMVRAGLTVGIPFVAVVAAIAGAFMALTPETLGAVLGHHLRQGRGMPIVQVFDKALGLYWGSLRWQPAYVALGLCGAAISLGWGERRARVYAWQLPTALAFLALTRDLQARHLAYLVPALAALAGLALDRLWSALAQRMPVWGNALLAPTLTAALVALALWPHVAKNAFVASWRDDTTPQWIAYIQEHTAPDEVVVSDYPGINFFAQRRSTRLAAGISEGAASSGQITGQALIAEIEESGAPLVLYNIAHGAHQFVNLRDHPALREYLAQHYHLSELRHYDHRLIEIYTREDRFRGTPMDVNLGGSLRLTGVEWLAPEAPPGADLRLNLRWTALAPMAVDHGVTLRLRDEREHVWGLGHKQIVDVADKTVWIDGIESVDPLPTSRWPAGEAAIAAYELPIDPGTPPGEYEVVLRVHPTGAWDGLAVIDPERGWAGYDVTIGRARVLPAPLPVDLSKRSLEVRHEVDVAPGLQLLGHAPLPGQVRPGDSIRVLACWRTLVDGPGPYRLRLTLEDDSMVWGDLSASIARDDYPTPSWRAGETLCGQYDLVVDAGSPDGPYVVRATITGEGGGAAGPPQKLGMVEVLGRERLYAPPEIGHPVDARLGDIVTLLGYDLEPRTLHPGGGATLTLYWRAEMRMSTPYKVFAHVIDRHGRVWGQRDNEPMEGAYPTTGWLPGEIVVDPYHLSLDGDAPGGTYQIVTGMYDASTMRRLPAVDRDGVRLEHDAIPVGTIWLAR